jgi:rhamnogalacturonyl hydrolase YesR/pectin methylesterase-like acyl-CoA thioesterase
MKSKRILMGCLGAMLAIVGIAQAQDSLPKNQKPWSVRMAESEMVRNPESWQVDFQPSLKWDYCHGLELGAMMDVYDRYGDFKFYEYALAYADTMVNEDGTIKKYKLTDYSLDRINSGKMLFRIYEQTKNDKYKKALDLLRSQFDGQPRNADGGFWHKKVYPNQMWLDGLYMGTPFLAEYAYRNNEPQAYQEVINQIKIVARHTYDPANGLFRHACDVSKREKWADKETGQSQHCWGRALGWYMMAIVDDLDFIPQHEPGRDTVLVILNHIAETLKKYQSPEGLWYQVMDKSGEPGNYLESSCSAMFVYSLFKAVRKGYIPSSYFVVARKGYEGILNEFIKVDDNGLVSITKACAVAGLGGKNYRMGDYDYYIHEQIRDNDPKAVGPFILASLEWEGLPKEKRRFAEPRELIVAQDGSGDYTTIGEALEAIRAFMDFDVKVYIKKGVYKEKLVVPSWLQHVEIIGEDVQNTIITHADHANMNHMGTFRTYTVKVEGNYITFRNITIENNAPRLGQAVALHTEGDCLRFINCRFLGNQDTVYTGVEGTRLYFENCYIEGTTDFIFGPSTAWFEGCTIHSKANSYITAASTPKDIEYGYVFHKCRLTAAEGVDKVYLGRPWRPYACTIFMNCELGKHIVEAGWDNWRNAENEKTARYAEYHNNGEGAKADNRVKWAKQLSDKEAEKITISNCYNLSKGWILFE